MTASPTSEISYHAWLQGVCQDLGKGRHSSARCCFSYNEGVRRRSLPAAFAAAVQPEEVERRDERDGHHVDADRDSAGQAAPRLCAEPLVQVARLHPLELRRAVLADQRRLHRHGHRRDREVRHHLRKKTVATVLSTSEVKNSLIFQGQRGRCGMVIVFFPLPDLGIPQPHSNEICGGY
jgi:hypothetical protein